MRSLFYIAILIVVSGCCLSSAQPRVLDDAQRLMQSDPVAALEKLNGVDVSEFQDSATMARWALLYSEALVANRLSAPTDTIVDIAIDFYGRHNLTDEFQKASRLKALIQSSVINDALSTALYLQKEKEFFIYKERVRRENLMYISILIMLISAVIIVWLRKRIKIQALQNEALIAEASSLRCQIDVSRGDVDRLETRLHGLLENRFKLIDSLCQTYYESQGTKTERKVIVDKVKSEIELMRTDSFGRMEHAVNACRDNLLVKVKDIYPEIKPEEYRLLVYLASGLSIRTICLLIGESVDVIYKRKSRLKARLREFVMPSCSEIMFIF